MAFLDGLSRGWVSIEVPGTASSGKLRTYVRYNHEHLPPAPVYIDSWDWLRAARVYPDSTLGQAQEQAVRDLTPHALTDLLTASVLPGDFADFADPGLRTHLRSATSCCFDLADHLEPVPGGQLLHLISDSQWTMHWLLYVGTDGASAVVTTSRPVGFDLGEEKSAYWDSEGWEYVRCADTFREFAWRWWMDNEIFWQVTIDHQSPTEEQQAYVSRYGTPGDIGAA